MRAADISIESSNTIKQHLEDKDRRTNSLASHELSGQLILLENVESRGLVIVNQKTSESTLLTDGEATQLLNVGRSGLNRKLQMVGIPIEPVIDEIKMENDNFLDEFPMSVMLDTTTIRSAELCMRGRITPVNLLDLSVFCMAAICYDRIFVQPVYSDLITKHPTLFSCIRYSREGIDGTLWTMCAELLNSHAPTSKDTSVYEEAWRKMFGRTDIRLNIQNTNQYQDSPPSWDGIPASHFGQSLFSGNMIDKDSMNAFLSVQTMRTLFNDTLAGFLSIPYLSTSIRAPVLAVIIKRKIQLQPVVDALHDALGLADVTPEENNVTFTSELYAPFFLGLVLEKASCPQDILPIVLEYRNKAETLRKQLRIDREEWSGRGRTYIKKMIASMTGFTDKEKELATTTIKTTVTILTPLVTASQPQTQMASLGIKLAMLLRPLDRIKGLYNRVFKPHVYWLSELADEAKALRNLEAQLLRVFGHSWSKDSRKCLELLADTYPASFAKLREQRD
jgi:hypothetical protein